ncbi:tetratricopeptide repeat protein [Roseateles noduli]|jgi:tetratricopeptide (TPR) repeat protein|uniref:tetratricopeptide repeat protein n=1 Tax=Roseateles noduli TaxID=2052484 RepID=UPI003D65257A
MTTNPPISAADILLAHITSARRAVRVEDVELHSSARRLSNAALDALVELAALTETTDEAAAEAGYRQAIANDPCHIEAFAQLTSLLSRQGRHDDALELIDQAVGWCSDIASLYFFAGKVQESAGRLTQAIAAFEQALDLNPALAEAHYRLGSLCEQLGEPRASAAHFRVYRRLVDENQSNLRLS